MSAKGRREEVRKRLRYNKKKDKRSVENEWDGMVNPQNLWKLSFEVLSSVDHRISSDQAALKGKLGEFGPEFDSLIHSLTNKMLFKDPFLHADDFLEILRKLLVTRSGAMVCAPDFFDAWLTTKAYEKGKTGKERWKNTTLPKSACCLLPDGYMCSCLLLLFCLDACLPLIFRSLH